MPLPLMQLDTSDYTITTLYTGSTWASDTLHVPQWYTDVSILLLQWQHLKSGLLKIRMCNPLPFPSQSLSTVLSTVSDKVVFQYLNFNKDNIAISQPTYLILYQCHLCVPPTFLLLRKTLKEISFFLYCLCVRISLEILEAEFVDHRVYIVYIISIIADISYLFCLHTY